MAHRTDRPRHRPLHRIAADAVANWTYHRRDYPAARPYAHAMLHLTTLDDAHGCDSGRDVVLRFLANAAQWRGGTAKAVKAELRAILAGAEGCVAKGRTTREKELRRAKV